MQRVLRSPLSKRIVLRTVLLFLGSYFIFLLAWMQVKNHYGYGVTYIASTLVTVLKEVRFEEMSRKGDVIQATFSRAHPKDRRFDILIDIRVKTSSYTFNVPLTLAIVASLFPFVSKKKRACLEAVLLLISVHLVYVLSLEANSITTFLVERGWDAVSTTRLLVYQFLWQFTNNMVIRFEPFLIGFYLFVRFGKAGHAGSPPQGA